MVNIAPGYRGQQARPGTNSPRQSASVHERNIAELADSMAELLATPAPPPKRPIGFINPEDKSSKKIQARRNG